MKNSRIAICSIVRDCKKGLQKNIPVIEELRAYFQSSFVIVFENDSIDGTKDVLAEWSKTSSNVRIESKNYNTQTIPPSNPHSGANRFFSQSRISKMAEYRNQYMEALGNLNSQLDFVMVVDLDISKIFIEGIIDSFALSDSWDVVCANGYSRSPKLKQRYHDSYALVELGHENIAQTEESIFKNQIKWGKLKKGTPPVPVYSAFGGLAIFHYNTLRNKRYYVIPNDDPKVEVRCEHYSLCHEIRKDGFNRIYINPAMTIKYQSIDGKLLRKFIKTALERHKLSA